MDVYDRTTCSKWKFVFVFGRPTKVALREPCLFLPVFKGTLWNVLMLSGQNMMQYMKCTNHPHTLDKICLSDSSSRCGWCGCTKQSEPEIWVTFQGHMSWFKKVQAYPAETKCPCTHTTYDYAWCMNISQPLNHWLKKPRTYIYILYQYTCMYWSFRLFFTPSWVHVGWKRKHSCFRKW